MRFQLTNFVDASDLFKNLTLAWGVFLYSKPSVIWANNAKSMVTPDLVNDIIKEAIDNQYGKLNKAQKREVNLLIQRLKAFPEETYIRLGH